MKAEMWVQLHGEWTCIAQRKKVSAQQLGQWRNVTENAIVPMQIREIYAEDDNAE